MQNMKWEKNGMYRMIMLNEEVGNSFSPKQHLVFSMFKRDEIFFWAAVEPWLCLWLCPLQQ
jgi:hypothetical protein